MLILKFQASYVFFSLPSFFTPKISMQRIDFKMLYSNLKKTIKTIAIVIFSVMRASFIHGCLSLYAIHQLEITCNFVLFYCFAQIVYWFVLLKKICTSSLSFFLLRDQNL
jgi:hypothetical protein